MSGPDLERLRTMSLEELVAYAGGWKPGSANHIAASLEIQRRQGTPAAFRSWLAIAIALVALCVSVATALLKP